METVTIWWVMLCVLACLNMGAWLVSAMVFQRQKSSIPPAVYKIRRWLLWLSFIYVAGCGFRSIFPMSDVPRIGVVDSWLTRIIVGRSVATIAELCFIAQCALILNAVGKSMKVNFVILVSQLLVPIIFVAELCSWYATLTTNYAGAVIEESLWAFSGVLLVASAAVLWPQVSDKLRKILTTGIFLGICYVAFMVFVDVPMYYARMQMDLALGREYLSLSQGVFDVMHQMTITTDWGLWREEIPWMTLYFSVAVWGSIALSHIPLTLHQPIERKYGRMQGVFARNIY